MLHPQKVDSRQGYHDHGSSRLTRDLNSNNLVTLMIFDGEDQLHLDYPHTRKVGCSLRVNLEVQIVNMVDSPLNL